MSRQSALASICDDTQGRHQSFHPRHGWLKRVYDEIHLPDPDDTDESVGKWQLFYSPHATTRLGVGKNMVDSIRYWGNAARLVREVPDPDNGRRTRAVPTLAGNALLTDEDGYDPFMERPGTWWTTHWLLLAPPRLRDPHGPVLSQLPSWWALLHLFAGSSFTVDEAVEWLVNLLTDEYGSAPSATSVKKDVQTFVHAYSRQVESRAKVDDLIDSPLRQLGLVEESYGEAGRYRLVTGPKHTLPPLVVAFAVLDFLDRRTPHDAPDDRPEFVEHIAAMDGSPARAFRITDQHLGDQLAKAATEADDAFEVRDDLSQGLRELHIADGYDYRTAADVALARYYKHPESKTVTDQPDPDALYGLYGDTGGDT